MNRMLSSMQLGIAAWGAAWSLVWGALLFATVPAHAQQTDALRPTVMAALQSVQALLSAGKPQDAQLTLQDIGRKVNDASLYETYMIERLKAATAVTLSDDAAAVAALEAALKTDKAAPAERLTIWAQLAGLSLKRKDMEAAGRWAAAHVQAGGTEDTVRAILVRAALAKDDCRTAVDQLQALRTAAERRGERPAEGQLRASAACHAKLGQDEGYYRDLERLVQYYPKPELWADLVARLQRRPGFADRLLLDTFRLMRHVGAMSDADDFLSAAQLALRAALPGEALQVLQAGFEAGALGKGPGAPAHRDLLARVTREAQTDRAQLPEAQRTAAAGSDARRQFLIGQATWSHGQAQQGAQMMQDALARGLARDADDARLHLAVAWVSAGRPDDARRLLASLPERDGLADLARLWLIVVR